MGDKLYQIRKKIDAMDQQILEALRTRTLLIEEVAKYKENDPVKIRPAREIQINEFLKQQEIPAYPAPVLQHIWRQIIGSTLLCEGDFPVGLYLSESDVIHDIQLRYQAKIYFGILCPLVETSDLQQCFEDLLSHKTQVAIISSKSVDQHQRPWWFALAQIQPRAKWNLRICLKLPLWQEAHMPFIDSFALSCAQPDKSGYDQSYFALMLQPEYYQQALDILNKSDQTLILDRYDKEYSIWVRQDHDHRQLDLQTLDQSWLLDYRFLGYAQSQSLNDI